MDWEKAGILQNETVWANAGKMPPEAWYEIYVKPWHQELARVGMQVLSRVISASSCGVTGLLTGTSTPRSATGLILQPLRSVSMFTQNSKLVASTSDADELGTMKMLLGTMKMFMFCTAGLASGSASGWTWPGPWRRGAEAPSLSFRREARGASRGSAPRRASANPASPSILPSPHHHHLPVSPFLHLCP